MVPVWSAVTGAAISAAIGLAAGWWGASRMATVISKRVAEIYGRPFLDELARKL